MAVSAPSLYSGHALVQRMLFVIMLHEFNMERLFLPVEIFFINGSFFVDMVKFFCKSTDCC